MPSSCGPRSLHAEGVVVRKAERLGHADAELWPTRLAVRLHRANAFARENLLVERAGVFGINIQRVGQESVPDEARAAEASFHFDGLPASRTRSAAISARIVVSVSDLEPMRI